MVGIWLNGVYKCELNFEDGETLMEKLEKLDVDAQFIHQWGGNQLWITTEKEDVISLLVQKANDFPDATKTVRGIGLKGLALNAIGSRQRVIKIKYDRDTEELLIRALKEALGIEIEVRRYNG